MDVFRNHLEELIKGASISDFIIDGYRTLLEEKLLENKKNVQVLCATYVSTMMCYFFLLA